MKPAAFRYVLAENVEHAVATLAAEGGQAKLLAGGQSLMPMMNFRLVRPSALIDVNRIASLSDIEEGSASVRIGAMARHVAVETSPVLFKRFPIIRAAMGHVAHVAVRNRGTIGGSLSHADPAAEWPLLARLLSARIQTASPRGAGAHGADGFFAFALTTALAPDEMIVGVEIPFLAPGTGWGFEELARRHGDYALAAVGATLRVERGAARDVRIAMMGVGDTPLRATEAERAFEGQPLSAESLRAAVDAVRGGVSPNTDLHGSADYRRHIVGVLARRAIEAAWRRAGDE